jgi:hypothetical protein
MTRIDLVDVLRRTVSVLYGDLVTRRTGEAVRGGVEALLRENGDDDIAVIDFSTVRLLDMSCADEIIGKLLLAHGPARHFVLVGVHAAHEDALLPVLDRHRLAVAAEDRSGTLKLLGSMPEPAHRVFHVLADSGPADQLQVAERLAVPQEEARAALDLLCERRVIVESDGHYQALSCA